MRLRDAIAGTSLAAIAEFKRRSPSAGDIRADADPAAFARLYERGGAAAMSVLVDERFAGSWEDLRAARSASTLPLLAKGFFTTEDDLRTAREAGADAVLLLLRDLDDDRARLLLRIAADLGLDALVEAHDPAELERAVQLGADPIGVNARDLATFAIDLKAQLALLMAAPADRLVVAESGIHERAQATRAELAGAGAILVGTSLMQAHDPAAKLRDLVGRPLVKVCGLTRQEDVDAAAEAGADMAGFILARESPRRAPRVLDTPEGMLSVAVVVGELPRESSDLIPDLIQYYEREDDHRARDAVLLNERGRVAQVLDLPWREEDPQHLERARTTEGRVMLAGGLSAENVRAAIETVRPWAVDASSRLEVEPGIKDHARVLAYVEAAHA